MGEFFDPISFLLGAGAAAGVSGGIYVMRDRLPKFGREESAESTPGILAPQSGNRYAQDMAAFFERMHMPGDRFKLTDVLIEPRLLKGRPPALAIDQDEEGIRVETDIYRVVPMLHQYPSLYASFNLDTISLLDLETGSRHAAILGIPGSGKSTALAVLGLVALGAIELQDFRTEEESQFDYDEEEKDLPEEIRERRRKEREDVQRRAIEQLRIIQKREEEAKEIEQRDRDVDISGLFPVYIHLNHLDLNPEAYGGTIDPAEPIVRALYYYVSKNTAELSPPLIYKMMTENRALILVDGFDEITPQEQEPYLDWLAALKENYGENFIIVTGPAVGYDMLANLGFAPAFIRPLNERHMETLLRKWFDKWKETAELPGQTELQRLLVDRRNRTVMDTTMKIWATLQGNIQETGRRGYYENYVRHQVGEIPSAVEILQDAAAYWLDTGHPADRATLEHIVRHHLGIEEEEPEADEEADKKKKQKKSQKPSKGAAEVDKTLRKISETALIHEHPDGSFAFKHPIVGWYLAAETLQGADAGRLMELAGKPNWHGSLAFATAFMDLEPTVLQKVRTQADLLFTNMFSVVDWMPDAPAGLRWKGEVLKRLGAAVMLPNQFPTVRELAVAALVSARDDTGGVTYIFRQAVRSGNANLRQLGCIGLGAQGSPEAVNDLKQMLFDEVIDVQLAAGLALGAIGNEDALTAMTEGLLEGDENLKKAVAESFAAISGEGHAILHDGITHENIEVRRACAFGLARIPATWALVALYRCMLEDSQWYVRQAAERAFAHAREPRSIGPQLYPEPEQYEWLIAWASKQGEAVPEGPSGRQILMRALQEAPAQLKIESAKALGRLAHVPAIKALYATLADQSPEVRVAAFDALGEMANRIGKPMPGVS